MKKDECQQIIIVDVRHSCVPIIRRWFGVSGCTLVKIVWRFLIETSAGAAFAQARLRYPSVS